MYDLFLRMASKYLVYISQFYLWILKKCLIYLFLFPVAVFFILFYILCLGFSIFLCALVIFISLYNFYLDLIHIKFYFSFSNFSTSKNDVI